MKEQERIELGRIKLEIPIDYLTILNLQIEEEKNSHGQLIVKLLIDGDTQENVLAVLKDAALKATLSNNAVVFSGIIIDYSLGAEAGYKEVTILAKSYSYKADKKKNSRTFQDPSKKLSTVIQNVLTGAVVKVKEDTSIPHIIYQNQETDWSFVIRIANQYGVPIFTDCRQNGIVISLGAAGFQNKELDSTVRTKATGKNLNELRYVQANSDSGASAFQYMERQVISSDLTIGTGDYAGDGFVTKSCIIVNKSLVDNVLYLHKSDAVKTSYVQMTKESIASNVITGTVLAVESNNVQVQFDADGGQSMGSQMWLPYESAISNSFYCMPDIGDKVFVYYENNGKAVCLGSRRADTSHPDFSKKEEKVLTANNKMVRFMPTSLHITSTRDLHDADSEEQITIKMDEKDGITITSGKDITIEAEEKLLFAAMEESNTVDFKESETKFNDSSDKGKQIYEADGGITYKDMKKMSRNKFLSDMGSHVWNDFANTAKSLVFWDVIEKLGKSGGDSTDSDAGSVEEVFEIGVLNITGIDRLTLTVGNSSIELNQDIVMKTPAYEWLGFEKKEHADYSKENRDWWDTALDGLQLVLDFAGFIPVFGAVFDVANAAISFQRGNFAEAALSLVSAIPGVGDAVGAVGKSAKIVKTVTKVMTKAQRIKATVKAFYATATLAATIFRNKEAISTVINLIKEDKLDLTNREQWDAIISTGQVVKSVGDAATSIGTAINGKVKVRGDGGDSDTNAKRRTGSDTDADTTKKSTVDSDGTNTQKKPSDSTVKADDSTNQTKVGDPVNIVTGSLSLEHTDLKLQDTTGEFRLKRTYESIYTNENRMAGSRWLFNVESSLHYKDDIMTILLPDMHVERFTQSETGWENNRAGDETFVFLEGEKEYTLKDISKKLRYTYSLTGKLLSITDKNNNSTEYQYEGDYLSRLVLASGQTLDFTYQNGTLSAVTDTLGRKVTYGYRGEYLTSVTYANKGTIRYEYNEQGNVKSVTDQNDHNYLTNYYDYKGRVTRQILADGEEYIYLYHEEEHCNTFLTASTGNELKYTYNKDKLITKITYVDGTYEEFDYDACQNKTYIRDRRGNITCRTYDTKGNLLEEVLSNGLKTTYDYDNNGNLLCKSDNAEGAEVYTYDEKDNLLTKRIKLSDTAWLTTSYTYDGRGRIHSITDGNGNRVQYEYHTGFSKPSVYHTREGEKFFYEYDEAGRLMAIQDAYGRITYGYNSMDYRTLIQDQEGNITKYQYDRLCNLVKIIYPNEYKQETGEGAGIVYDYDVMDRQVRITDALGNVVATPKDTEGNTIKEINPNTYDPLTGEGVGIGYEYDVFKHRIKINYPGGGTERIVYDANGNIINKIQPLDYQQETDVGKGYEYTYDAMNRLVAIRNPLGVVEKAYVYDLKGNIIKEMGAKGYKAGNTDEERIGNRYQYNAAGLLTERREAVLVEEVGENDCQEETTLLEVSYRLVQYRYDKTGMLVEEKRFLEYQKEKGAFGAILSIHYRYDKNNRLVQVHDSTGASIWYRYNSNNKLVYEKRKISDTVAQVKEYTYNSIGRLISITQNGEQTGEGMTYSTTKFTYDKTGNLTRILTPKGHEIRREYDSTNRLVAEFHVEKGGEIKNQTAFTYDKAGNLIKVTDNNGQAISYAYDLLNRETKRVSKNGGIQQKVYDKNGRVVKLIQPNEYAKLGEQAQGYQYDYDILGRIRTITAPDSTIVTSNAYNEAGELIHQTDASGYGIHTVYDFAGRRKKVTTDGNSSQEYEYDASGNIVGVLDGNLHKTRYEVDNWGRVTAVNMPEGTKESYCYDYAGNITATMDGEGNTISYTYNALGKVAKIKDQAGTEETFLYDPEGNLREYTDRNQNTLLYSFNLYGNLTGKRVKDGADSALAEAFGYYADGTLKYATSQGMRYDYSYYPDGSLKEKRASGRTLLHYTYDLNGNKTSQTDFTGKTTRYQYDILDRLEEVYDNGRKQAGYTYYPDGSIKELQVGDSLITSYTYDADKNLTGLRTTLAGETLVENQYTFDHNGNCQKKQGLGGTTTYTYDSKNQLVQAAYPTYTEELYYDKAGNRTKRLAKGLEELYQYDERNRLTEQRIQDQTTGVTQEVNAFTYDLQGNLLKDAKAEYTYDGFNRMVKAETAEGNVQVNHYDAEGLRSEIEENGKLVQFLYSGREVVAETKEDESVIRHIRGYSLISSDSEKAKTYYHYASDELGSITHITNEEQEVLNQYEYDAFGNVIASKEQIENRFRFCGEQYDQVTGQYYLRARYYNPVIARFTQEDTYRGDGLNLYAYCANNPVRYYDPSGNDKTDVNNKYSGDQKALKDLIDEINERGGATPDEAGILNEWKKEYGVPPTDLDIKKQLLLPGPVEVPKPDVPSSKNSQGGSDEGVTRETGARKLDGLSVKELLALDDQAAGVYETIRNSSDDITKISSQTGIPEWKIKRIKEHVFFNEHSLSYGTGRFDPDIEIADAWNRLENGTYNQNDLDLLKHEYYECRFEAFFNTDYSTAHSKTVQSGRPWDPYKEVN